MSGTTPQADELRSNLANLVTLAGADIADAMRQFDNAETLRDGLIDVLRGLLPYYGSAAASLAADWYDELRAQDNVKGRFRAIVPDQGDLGAEELVRWGIAPLFHPEPDPASALTLIQGGAQRRILNQSRATITGSAVEDPQAHGWQRAGSGECAFCAMLISRGAVYTRATADFASHDHCHCTAVPAWDGRPRPVRPYTPSNRNIDAADRARVREYLRTH